MPNNAEIFSGHLEAVFGTEAIIKKHECPRGGPPVFAFIYRDIPEKGMVTGITYGLSVFSYPDWKLSRPEMILSMETEEVMWGWVAAYFAAVTLAMGEGFKIVAETW